MKLFFSWQSDIPEVKSTLRGILQRICGELEVEYDEDSRGEDSAEYILDNILRKIDNSTIVVGDLTSIGVNEDGEKIPNPNVSFEVGYSEARVTRKNLILVFCLDYGTRDDLPFDLSKRSTHLFSLKDPNSVNIFEARLKKAIRKLVEAPVLISQVNLDIYQKTILYWLNHYPARSVHDIQDSVTLRDLGDPLGSFNEEYDEQEYARFSHALKSLTKEELILSSNDRFHFGTLKFTLSEKGEKIAQTLLPDEIKPLIKEGKD